MKKYLYLFILLFFSLIPLLGLFHSGLPITHDGQDHVARIANFYKNLEEGVIVPRWAANLNWGYGHPILMFLYPLPSYFASFFHFLGFSFIDSVKIVFGTSFVFSGLFMYLWLKEFLGEKGALIGGVIYMIAPYRFIDLYVRGAIGESMAFVFPPLILYFIYKIYKERKMLFVGGGALSFAAFILSHNAISIMFVPIIFLYILFLYFFNGNRDRGFIFRSLLLIVLGFGLSSFFLLPAFLEGKYTLRDIVTSNGYVSRFVNSFRDFLYGSWSYGGSGEFSVQVGIINWILAIISLPLTYILHKRKNKLWILSAGLLLIFIFTMFLMMPYSKFIWEKITTLQKFQFPWRFLSVVVFVTSVLSGLLISFVKKNLQLMILFIVLISILFFNKDYWHVQAYLYKPDGFFKDIYSGTTDTGESAPIWSVRFMEKKPNEHLEMIDGNINIKELKRTSTNHLYKFSISDSARLVDNTLYFPGWEVLVDGNKTDIQFQDPSHRGLMTFYVEKGDHMINVIFKDTKLRIISNLISLFSLILVFTIFILRFVRK